MTPLAALLLAAAACGEPATTAREECERLLRSARLAKTEKLPEGITGSSRVELREAGVAVHAVFKVADTSFEALERIGSETVKRYRDSWKHEVAAYELDKLLGLRLVPTVVERKLGGKRGSLQAWIERPLARFGVGPPPPASAWADDGVHAARFFDYLIYNRDRHLRNVMFASDWRPIAIDNSIAFQAFQEPFRPLYRFPRAPAERLARLDTSVLKQALSRYLERDEIDGLVKRCDRLRSLIAAARAEAGDAEALFDWP